MGRFDLVTFTFGGDDVDFADVIKQCIHLKLPGTVKYPSDPGHHCPKDSLLRSDVASFAPVFEQRLIAIANAAVVAHGTILVLGYPDLIESPALWPEKDRKAGGCGHLNTADAYEVRGLAGDLTATIAQDVTSANRQHPNGVRFLFLDVNSGGSAGIPRDDSHLFEPSRGIRHNLCSGDTWINPVSAIDYTNGSYHPKQAGQDAMGALAAKVIRGLVWKTAPMSLAARVCPAEPNATQVRTQGLTCRTASNAVAVYEGAPTHCVAASSCGQSGENGIGGALMFVDCRRDQLNVSCVVYVKSRTGRVVNPHIFGIVTPGRFVRGIVRFTMRHDPYGCLYPICPGG